MTLPIILSQPMGAGGGGLVVSLMGYVPPPRYDGVPWTVAVIEEAASSDGPWTTIESPALFPIDSDPSTPLARSFTTSAATLDAGWYRITWQDGNGDVSLPTAPLFTGPSGTDAMRPTVQRIAAILRARPRTEGGRALSTFTSETNPTAEQVEELIDEAMAEIGGQVGVNVPEAAWTFVASTAAVRAAQFVELGYPEVLGTARTAFDELETIYKDRLAALILAVQEAETDEGIVAGDSGGAFWGFPDQPGYITEGWA